MADYKDTIFLPQTSFPMRASLNEREPEILKHWQKLDLYHALKKKNKGKPVFSYHDGPPYANGNIHAGHAVGKILRDAVVRAQSMSGKDVRFKPGWDCHGLPIEWKIEEEYRKNKKDKDQVPILEFRKECREFAQKWVNIQREEFKRLGVQADWDNPYLTMNLKSEAAIYRELTKFILDGSLYRGLKSVMWSVVEKTSLAEAEVEYHDHVSHTIHVAFPIVTTKNEKLKDAHMVIWTTTPWTIPANRAIAYNPDIKYITVEVKKVMEGSLATIGHKYVVAADLEDEFMIAARISSASVDLAGPLDGSIAAHPLRGKGYDFDVPLVPGDHVTTEAGTGLVHIAPSHGEDDFNIGKKYNLEITEMVDDAGVYTPSTPLFAGIHVFKAHDKVIPALEETGLLVAKGKLTHSYPHSWRSRSPLIFRATPQWFISVETTGIRDKALKAISEVRWIPAKGENRIRAMVETRPDWLISRQRAWGVPIAIFVHKQTNEILKDKDVLDRIIAAFEVEGADAWYAHPASYFLGDKYKAHDYNQIFDVVDVWFEAGCSHAFVLDDEEDEVWPADLYLEGSDQHRGWFQASLLESCGTRGTAPFKAVVTHGFINDDKGYKMSKSLGNVIAPQDLIKDYGADVLRLWSLQVDWKEDMKLGKETMKQPAEAYRRFRNTLRFILGNLDGYTDAEKVDAKDMPELEQWVLHRLFEVDAALKAAVNNYDFFEALNEIYLFCHQELSAFYFDVRKDALYCDATDSLRRKSARTVLNYLFDCLTKWLAPFISFTAEEAWLTRSANPETDSVHLHTFPTIPADWKNEKLADKWKRIRDIRRVVTGALEVDRANKKIGSSLQANPTVYIALEDEALFKNIKASEIFITSDAKLMATPAPANAFTAEDIKHVAVTSDVATGEKCERCWMILPTVGKDTTHPTLCDRCVEVVVRGSLAKAVKA